MKTICVSIRTILRHFAFVVVAAALTLSFAASAQAETLKERLDARRAEFLKTAPADKAQSYQAGIDSVAASGIYDRALKTGAKAPDFTLKNAEGQPTRLSELLKKGPVVLTWYRGGWCPYCNLALAALTEKMTEITVAGGQLVALTPELPEHADETVGAVRVVENGAGLVGRLPEKRREHPFGSAPVIRPEVHTDTVTGALVLSGKGDASTPPGAA